MPRLLRVTSPEERRRILETRTARAAAAAGTALPSSWRSLAGERPREDV